MKRFAFLVVCFVIPASTGYAQNSKIADINILFEVTNTKQLMIDILPAVIGGIEPMVKLTIESQFRDYVTNTERISVVILEEMKRGFELAIDELIVKLVPIYDKYFTHSEVRELIIFYNTDLGRKSLSVFPLIFAESAAAGQQWGVELGIRMVPTIIDRLIAERIIVE